MYRRILHCLGASLLLGVSSSAWATTVAPPEFSTLVNESDLIVRAVTKVVTAEKRSGPRGAKIYTRVEFEVVEAIAGDAPRTLVLDFLGGRVGDEEMTVGGMPQFRVGDEDILFVRDKGRTICPLYAMMYGRYGVATDGRTGQKFVARSDGDPLRSVAEISAPVADGESASRVRAASADSALHPSEFSRQIRAAIRPNARVNRAK